MGHRVRPEGYFWPDVAHRGPAFIAWHRAYLLQFERELQRIDPSVALPYWRMDSVPSPFDAAFMGANVVVGSAFVAPTFEAGNPLANWIVGGEALLRLPYERNDEANLKAQFFSDDVLFMRTTFSAFSRTLEGNPHNVGHNWTGPWMRNCMISPSDPVFWPFHTGFDRQWAKWQWLGGHIQPDGSSESYFPSDAYDGSDASCNSEPPNSCVARGHHLKDTMWPWDSIIGPGATVMANRPAARLSSGLIGAFPPSSIAGLWPANLAQPTPADVIDFAGASPNRLDMGFAYDDVPYGVKVREIAMAPTMVLKAELLSKLSDAALPVADRVAAGRELSVLPEIADQSALAALAASESEPIPVRTEALRILGGLTDGSVVSVAIEIVADQGGSSDVRLAAIDALSMQMMFADISSHQQHTIMDALHTALADGHHEIRLSALRVLASDRDAKVIKIIADQLTNPGGAAFAPDDGIMALIAAGGAKEMADVIRPYLSDSHPGTRAAAVTALVGDLRSSAQIAAILANRSEPEEVRTAALAGLTSGGGSPIETLVQILQSPEETSDFKAKAASVLASAMESSADSLTKAQLQGFSDVLRTLSGELLAEPDIRRALSAAEAERNK
ncbi:tyrosinase family protein [Mesorhizobium sp. M0644]